MSCFLAGVAGSFVAALLYAAVFRYAWPPFYDAVFYNGIRVDGKWEIAEHRNGEQITVGEIEFKQAGRRVTGSSVRRKRRDGTDSNRQFEYNGFIHKDQLTLTFEDKKGSGFDTGTYVFIVQNDGAKMVGMATFHGKQENKIVSEQRALVKKAT